MAVAAVAMLASCSNDETTGKAVKGNAIQFDGFVNKSVKRPTTSTTRISPHSRYGA